MKQISSISYRVLALSFLLLASPFLRAAELQTSWNDVCRVSYGHELAVTRTAGDVVYGQCYSVSPDNIVIRAQGQQLVTIARTAFSRLQMRSKRRHLTWLGENLQGALFAGTLSLFTPYAPAGLVVIPVTLAWGAVAAPFCALGDLADKMSGPTEIKIL